MVVAEVEMQTCKNCGLSFGQDEAKVCVVCNSYICPNCLDCGCTIKGTVNKDILGDNFIRGSFD